ncbi:RusA family crossover junction endodeoxyribonuclease [Schaalia sp. lx-260]|uniref:RusA family crossover junction endodeoxyribonuclease n=1 Tax=Schaalia sp. lx-260 TaxID=2899082 RepID=UPI001E39513B|nr:RusA family crossover junction endodeoxyribonuclease [Schaalia sp. lx-260]MCD4549692.1 RusA family crossover junction endodeoxyribonuclease [Schaalia sp. lx-260]
MTAEFGPMCTALGRVWVAGVPVPQGSMKVFTGSSRPVMVHHKGAELKAWRTKVAFEVTRAAQSKGWELPLDEPVSIDVSFHLPRPTRARFDRPATKPDLDKLMRAIGDALTVTGNVIKDDSRIVRWIGSKHYAGVSMEGVSISVFRLPAVSEDVC